MVDDRLNPWKSPVEIESEHARSGLSSFGNDGAEIEADAHSAASSSTAISRPVKVLLVVSGILVPGLCHGVSFLGPPTSPTWQSGELSDKLGYIIAPQAGWVLYPLLCYAMVSLAYFLIREQRGLMPSWVRFGIGGGIPLAIFYTVILDTILLNENADLLSLIGLISVQFGIPLFIGSLVWLHRRADQPKFRVLRNALMSLTLAAAIIGMLFVNSSDWLSVIIGFPIVLSLFAGPGWALFAYAYVTRVLHRRQQTWQDLSKPQMVGGAAYFAAIAGACPTSILLSLNRYSTLPVTPPSSCYVVTAASRGHVWLVNKNQLVALKMFELVLQARHPRTHRMLRLAYDRIGPALARRISNPWLADVAYLLLKPVEWLARLALIVWQTVSSVNRSFNHEDLG
ncbi:hypothetical protein N9N28_12910 [Rubripirellula amarantea]|nr:hypothetical protein [Rubripirellula amarantea]